MWEVLEDPEYRAWFDEQSASVQDSIIAAVLVLAEFGPNLGRTYVDTLKGTTLPNLKELRVKHARRPYRILFAFDPIRLALLLVGGDKARDKRWYTIHVPIAEARFARHLRELEEEKETP